MSTTKRQSFWKTTGWLGNRELAKGLMLYKMPSFFYLLLNSQNTLSLIYIKITSPLEETEITSVFEITIGYVFIDKWDVVF